MLSLCGSSSSSNAISSCQVDCHFEVRKCSDAGSIELLPTTRWQAEMTECTNVKYVWLQFEYFYCGDNFQLSDIA